MPKSKSYVSQSLEAVEILLVTVGELIGLLVGLGLVCGPLFLLLWLFH